MLVKGWRTKATAANTDPNGNPNLSNRSSDPTETPTDPTDPTDHRPRTDYADPSTRTPGAIPLLSSDCQPLKSPADTARPDHVCQLTLTIRRRHDTGRVSPWIGTVQLALCLLTMTVDGNGDGQCESAKPIALGIRTVAAARRHYRRRTITHHWHAGERGLRWLKSSSADTVETDGT